MKERVAQRAQEQFAAAQEQYSALERACKEKEVRAWDSGVGGLIGCGIFVTHFFRIWVKRCVHVRACAQEEARRLAGEAAQAKQEAQETLRQKDKVRTRKRKKKRRGRRMCVCWDGWDGHVCVFSFLLVHTRRGRCIHICMHAWLITPPPSYFLPSSPRIRPPPQSGAGAGVEAGGGRGLPPRAAPAAGGGDGPSGGLVGWLVGL